jgi:hypothetical protein
MATDNGGEIDWGAVLRELEARRDKLNLTIENIREIIAGSPAPTGRISPPGITATVGATEVTSDAFFGLSIPEAARKYLRMSKKPRSTSEICRALKEGGLTSTAKHFYSTVYPILERQQDIVRVGKNWGLLEWYPGMKGKGKAKTEASPKGQPTNGINPAVEEDAPPDDIPF